MHATDTTSAPSAPFAVSDATYAEQVERRPGLTVVDVWATWCGPCRLVAPIVAQLASDYAGQASFATLDSDENPVTTTRLGVRSLPTLLFVRDGRVVDRIVGAVPRARIEATLRQHLDAAHA